MYSSIPPVWYTSLDRGTQKHGAYASGYVCVAEIITSILWGHHCNRKVNSLKLGHRILVEQNKIKKRQDELSQTSEGDVKTEV